MTRLAYIYHTDFDPTNAHGNQIIHTCNGLKRLGHDVTLVTAGDPKTYARANDLSIEFDIVYTGATGEHTVPDRLRYYLSALVRACSADVIFTRDVSFLHVLRRLPSWLYPSTIYEAHKAYSGIDEISPTEEKSRVESVDSVITIAPGITADLEALDLSVDAVVPDAATASLVPDSRPRDLEVELGVKSIPVFVYAGSISAWKNDLELVVEGFASIVKDVDAKLLVVGGDDEEVESLEAVAVDHGVGDYVEFVGRVPQETVFDYLALSDVGFVPLKESDRVASHYTSPLKLYEYLVSGLDVVSSDVPTIAETADSDNRIHLYEPTDVEGFVEASLEALDAARSQTRETGAYQYTYERRSDQIDDVISELID